MYDLLEISTIIIYSHYYSVVENFKCLPLSLDFMHTFIYRLSLKMMTSSENEDVIKMHGASCLSLILYIRRIATTKMFINVKTSEIWFVSVV